MWSYEHLYSYINRYVIKLGYGMCLFEHTLKKCTYTLEASSFITEVRPCTADTAILSIWRPQALTRAGRIAVASPKWSTSDYNCTSGWIEHKVIRYTSAFKRNKLQSKLLFKFVTIVLCYLNHEATLTTSITKEQKKGITSSCRFRIVISICDSTDSNVVCISTHYTCCALYSFNPNTDGKYS